jgi:hypothetical protein
MAYNVLYNTLKIDKHIVREILDFLPETTKIYTEKCFEDVGGGIYDYKYYKSHELPFSEYYKATFYDCIQNMYTFTNPTDLGLIDNDDEL